MTNTLDLAGTTFGRLTVLRRAESQGRRTRWECRCDCGAIATVRTEHLRGGKTKSCGCLQSERRSGGNITHGGRRTRAYHIWSGMKTRCNNPKSKAYPNYGGRGITVCERWINFENFYADMGEPPEGYHLDRRNNNDGYGPENCIWAPLARRGRNQRRSRLVEFEGETLCLADWAERLFIPYGVLLRRLDRGLSMAEAINEGWETPHGSARRVKAALESVSGILTAALEAGVVSLLRKELRHLVRLLEPLERDGGLNVPGLATLNGARAALAKAEGDEGEQA